MKWITSFHHCINYNHRNGTIVFNIAPWYGSSFTLLELISVFPIWTCQQFLNWLGQRAMQANARNKWQVHIKCRRRQILIHFWYKTFSFVSVVGASARPNEVDDVLLNLLKKDTSPSTLVCRKDGIDYKPGMSLSNWLIDRLAGGLVDWLIALLSD